MSTDQLVRCLTAQELADLFRIGPERVKRHCTNGEWPYTKFGRNIRFTPEQVQAIVAIHAHQEQQPAPRTRRIHHRRTK